MNSESTPNEVTAFHLVNKVIYGAFLFSLVAYWLAHMFVNVPRAQATGPVAFPLQEFLPFIAGADALIALYFRFARLGPLLSEVGGDIRRRMNQMRFFYLICWVLSESVALLGFAIPFFTARLEDAAPYFVGSIALFLLCYPKSPDRPVGL